ncbi:MULTISPECIES: site-2 protease family protein [Oceanithermus]|uniref:Membrane protein n=2 Tax=Oceanithermus desulfurans TaxID=227924 RepID=A0A511RI01_9DEIN|nr:MULTISPECIES: site-2 protease family protein [Oceanithermus]MBB6030415.1 Zn-dependent protease [Oceanithermus desulfurans]GEM89284.1 membrane protein [Oceanithermus desulfurans NBRC 100063]
MGLLVYLSQPLVFLVAFAAAAFGLVVHNLVQAWLADRYGDALPRRMGFLTLDAKTHLDPLGLLFLALLGFGWPRSVPFRLNGSKGLIVALSGPVGFLLAAFVYLLVASLLPRSLGLDQIAFGLQVAAGVMVIEAAVFLFPVPPLDGARAIYAAGSYEARRFMDQLASYGPIGFILIFLVLSYTGVLGAVQAGLMGLLQTLLRLIGL